MSLPTPGSHSDPQTVLYDKLAYASSVAKQTVTNLNAGFPPPPVTENTEKAIPVAY